MKNLFVFSFLMTVTLFSHLTLQAQTKDDIVECLTFEQNNADEAITDTGNQQIQDVLGVDMEYRWEFE